MENNTTIGSLGKQSLKSRFGSPTSDSDDMIRDFANEDNWSTASTARGVSDSPESKKRSIEAQLQQERHMRQDVEDKVCKLRKQRHSDANRLVELKQRNADLERQSRVDANRVAGLEEIVAGHEKLHTELTEKLHKMEEEKKAAEKAAERLLKQKDKPTILFL